MSSSTDRFFDAIGASQLAHAGRLPLDLDQVDQQLAEVRGSIDHPDAAFLEQLVLKALGCAERLRAEVNRLRERLRDADNDLLAVRGALSPNGGAPVTPVPLVPTVAPAVAWLTEQVQELREQLAAAASDLLPIGEPLCPGGHPSVDYSDPTPVPVQYDRHMVACPDAPAHVRDAAQAVSPRG